MVCEFKIVKKQQYIQHTHDLSAEGAKADKKRQTLDDPLHFKIQSCSISLFCSFPLFFPFPFFLFKSFQIVHGAISPSQMVLLFLLFKTTQQFSILFTNRNLFNIVWSATYRQVSDRYACFYCGFSTQEAGLKLFVDFRTIFNPLAFPPEIRDENKIV